MLETARVRLRRLADSDLEAIHRLEADPEVVRFTPIRTPQTWEQSRERLNKQLAKVDHPAPLGIWGAELREEQELVGWFMLMPVSGEDPELGFMIARRCWNAGLTTEIARELLRCGFALPEVRLVASCTDPENAASMRVLEKLGFERRPLGSDEPQVYFELTRQRWEAFASG